MPVEIVSPGKFPGDDMMEGWCTICRCHVRAKRKECFHRSDPVIEEVRYSVDCPMVQGRYFFGLFTAYCQGIAFMRPERT